ncbi:tetratricopeptide repeat protein [Ktedonospora formicarum]|uniref:MalT-like TPR region domain-containing protein n=1 Tax=Ktedonospora formicarum TaxID=2778364 RepID=A0A8J3I2M5_9CHLR|nr:tetratricopeptide repeat protein [Ktedonospora formicarum]GHO46471.1 hypothetical protein KSX_46340 [Ktedonospora formicarum]
MPAILPTSEELAYCYTTANDALSEIARTYFMSGRLEDAQRLLGTALPLLEAREATLQQRLKLLHLYGQVLVVDHLLKRGDPNELLSICQQAMQAAEAIGDNQGIADMFSLLGQAYNFVTTVESLKRGESPNSTRAEGKYVEALNYQQQALQLREVLGDKRGMSESYFQIGLVYERWQEHDVAQEYYHKARLIADENGYMFEKTEPARHVAINALRLGNLDQALTLALEALKLREESGFRPYLPLDHLLVRDMYTLLGDDTNARLHERRAIELAEEMGLFTLVSSMPNLRNYVKGQ